MITNNMLARAGAVCERPAHSELSLLTSAFGGRARRGRKIPKPTRDSPPTPLQAVFHPR